jgi:hypothetical protein
MVGTCTSNCVHAGEGRRRVRIRLGGAGSTGMLTAAGCMLDWCVVSENGVHTIHLSPRDFCQGLGREAGKGGEGCHLRVQFVVETCMR